MTMFEKPGRREWDYPDMAREAGGNALADAGIAYEEIEQAAPPRRVIKQIVRLITLSTVARCSNCRRY